MYPAGHVHVYPPWLSFEHEAPFWHWLGLSSHGKSTNSIKFENQFFFKHFSIFITNWTIVTRETFFTVAFVAAKVVVKAHAIVFTWLRKDAWQGCQKRNWWLFIKQTEKILFSFLISDYKRISHFSPVNPFGHEHVEPPLLSLKHDAPFWHCDGFRSHGKALGFYGKLKFFYSTQALIMTKFWLRPIFYWIMIHF